MYINSPEKGVTNQMSMGFSQQTLQEHVLWRMNFPQQARAHTCFPSHVQGLDRVCTRFPSTTQVEELLHQIAETWGGVCMPVGFWAATTRGGPERVDV